ncbi:MAG: thioredoxin family protein [Salinivirgaceae bacterium]|nr:thioredoxin family protein [Salinivirgaceae bacterium]
MKIVVLGTGCSKCKSLYSTVMRVVDETGINAEVVKQEDMAEILKFNVMTLPALVIDGRVAGKGLLSADEVRNLINLAM